MLQDTNGSEPPPQAEFDDTYDDIMHLLDDESFSPSSFAAAGNDQRVKCSKSPISQSDESQLDLNEDIHFVPTQSYTSQNSQDESSDIDIFDSPSPLEDMNRKTLPRSFSSDSDEKLTGTPKRAAASPVGEARTPAKQQKLPASVENNVKVTPVRNWFQNLSTE